MVRRLRNRLRLAAVLVPLALAGCGSEVESAYGRVRDRSVNGTGAFAELLRREGHTVRTAVRLNDTLGNWADVIVRFAPYPGPPSRQEGQWYVNWLSAAGQRSMIYVPRDYNALAEYWDGVIATVGPGGDPDLKARAERQRDHVPGWADRLPARSADPAPAEEWFEVIEPANPPEVCKTLGGPWAASIDPVGAALTRHQTLKVNAESVLLEGDHQALAMQWGLYNGSRVLVVANGTFLLNATLVNRERRPLALRAARWVGPGPRKVAFIEGSFVVGERPASPSPFDLLKIPPFGWVAAQLGVLGLAACLARAPRLGRPRLEPPSDEDRPAAHPEALGSLMARTGQTADARALLDAYRRWRNASPHPRAEVPAPANEPIETTLQPESPAHE